MARSNKFPHQQNIQFIAGPDLEISTRYFLQELDLARTTKTNLWCFLAYAIFDRCGSYSCALDIYKWFLASTPPSGEHAPLIISKICPWSAASSLPAMRPPAQPMHDKALHLYSGSRAALAVRLRRGEETSSKRVKTCATACRVLKHIAPSKPQTG